MRTLCLAALTAAAAAAAQRRAEVPDVAPLTLRSNGVRPHGEPFAERRPSQKRQQPQPQWKSVLHNIQRRRSKGVSARSLLPLPEVVAADTDKVGGDRDEHDCIPSAGYTWCDELSECIRPWETPCPVALPTAPPPPKVDASGDMGSGAAEPAVPSPAAAASPSYRPTVIKRYEGTFAQAFTDRRTYRYLEIDNGMQVLLGSDPRATMAAAAVDVSVGSYQDPPEVPGMAHFCEHMLFLSNAKYPQEDEYEKFLASAGGGSNAFTASTRTVYFNDVSARHFEGALDRLANFFVEPTFHDHASSDQVDRERNAVDSENSKNLQDDEWRVDQLLRSLSSNMSSHHSFGTGNKETLQGGEKLREKLSEWYEQHYAPSVMSVALTSNQSLDTLEKWAVRYFGQVEPRPGVIPGRSTWWQLAVPDDELPRIVRYEPIGPDSLQLVWFLPGEKNRTLSHPLSALSSLLGKERNGSLTLALLKAGWIEGMSAGAEEEEEEESVFSIGLTLTEAGLSHVHEVIETVFAAIDKAKATAQDSQWWREEVRAQDLAFMYRPPMTASDEMVELAGMLKEAYELEQLPKAAYVAREHDADELVRLLELMSVERVTILFGSHNHTDDMDDWQAEKWYGTRYHVRKLNQQEHARYAAPATKLVALLGQPEVNPFFPSDEGLKMIDDVAEPSEGQDVEDAANSTLEIPVPQLLSSDPSARLFHVVDTSFNTPMAFYGLKIFFPHVAHSGLGRIVTSVQVRMANEQMRSLKQQLLDAGIQFDLSPATSGVELTLAGFSERLPQVTLAILDQLANLTADTSRFNVAMQQTRTELQRWDADNPGQTAVSVTGSLLSYLGVELPPTQAALLDGLSIASVFGNRTHINMLREVPPVLEHYTAAKLARARADGQPQPRKHQTVLIGADSLADVPPAPNGTKAIDFLALGNVKADVAKGILVHVNERLFGENTAATMNEHIFGETTSATSESAAEYTSVPPVASALGPPRSQARMALASGQRLAFAIEHPSPEQAQSAVQLTIQLGRKDALGIQRDAAAVILGRLIPPLFFADLRTVQQLGYVVQASLLGHFGMRELTFLVQGTAQAPGNVTRSILAFVDSMPDLVEKLSDDEFSMNVASARTELLQKPPSIEEADTGLGTTLFSQISENCTSYFDYYHQLAEALERITPSTVRALAEAIVAPHSPYSRLLVQVYGRKQQAKPASPAFPTNYTQLDRKAHFQEASFLGCQGPKFRL